MQNEDVHQLLTGSKPQQVVIFTSSLLTDVHRHILRCLQVGQPASNLW